MKATKVQGQSKGFSALLADVPRIEAHKYSREYHVPEVRLATARELDKLQEYYRRKDYR